MSTTIEQRWSEYRRNNSGSTEQLAIGFAQAERALQRQEVADEFRHYCQGLSDPWEEKACNLILSAGTEPTNPFGCGCWRLTNNMWTRNDTATIGCFVVMPSDAAFCDRCGAKRRE